jgi:hypothetical protein
MVLEASSFSWYNTDDRRILAMATPDGGFIVSAASAIGMLRCGTADSEHTPMSIRGRAGD